MSLLVDTQALLWFVEGDPRLSRRARFAIESEPGPLLVSMAAWWEMGIKHGLGRLRLEPSLEAFAEERLREGFRILPIELPHVIALTDLPFHHRDPFDRMMIAQAREEDLPVCTADPAFRLYGVEVVW